MQKATTTKLRPLRRISPSRYTAINRCAYREVLSNSYDSPLLAYPPANHLGNVIHESIQLIVTGKVKSDAEFDAIWNHLLAKQEKALKDMGFGFFTPLSENVPGYTIKKLQVKSLLKGQNKSEAQKPKNISASTLTEKWLEAHDSLIGGFADIIINLNGYTKLLDFKSGKILIEEGKIKEEYEDQLKLYAYLHNQVYGKYPDELSIVDIEKNEYPINFTPQECEALAIRSRNLLSKINSLVEMNHLEALAKPDSDNCKSCLYRPACNFYWKLPISETGSILKDVKGDIVKVSQFRNGNLNVTLNTGDKMLIVSHVTSSYLPFLTDSIGKKLAFYNVKESVKPGNYKTIKTTKIYEA